MVAGAAAAAAVNTETTTTTTTSAAVTEEAVSGAAPGGRECVGVIDGNNGTHHKWSPSRLERLREKHGLPAHPRERVVSSSLPSSGALYDQLDAVLAAADYDFRVGRVIAGRVLGYDPQRGALIDIGAKTSALLPNEHVSLQYIGPTEQLLPIDDEREFKIIAEPNAGGRLTVSLRALALERNEQRIAQLADENVPMHVQVVDVNRGGLVVLLEGMRAFIPRSHKLVPDDVCNKGTALVGTALRAKFIAFEPENRRYVLSQRLAEVENLFANYSIGALVDGVITAVRDFGAFVDVSTSATCKMTGILHKSQISNERVSDATTVLECGERIKCLVIGRDHGKYRVMLATRGLERECGAMLRDKRAVFARAPQMAERHREQSHARQQRAVQQMDDVIGGFDIAALLGEASASWSKRGTGREGGGGDGGGGGGGGDGRSASSATR